ncbi:MAG TPA: hypothetical protein VNP04_22320 [Alphaproteobacteria bacterium]|nr:hypothetical protein [Alphaproteobacteria bacterium]
MVVNPSLAHELQHDPQVIEGGIYSMLKRWALESLMRRMAQCKNAVQCFHKLDHKIRPHPGVHINKGTEQWAPLPWRLACLPLILVTLQSAWAGTVLGDLAARMQPGAWVELQTNGFNNGKILEPCLDGSNIVEYADNAMWDPISRRFLFYGASHGSCYSQKFIIYNDATNTWTTSSVYPGSCSGSDGCFEHAYHHNALNTSNGDFYYRSYNSLNIWRYTTNGGQQWNLLTNQTPEALVCCSALAYFPEMDSLIWISARSRGVYRYSFSTGQWYTLATGLAMGDYDNVIQYNSVQHVMLLGGGRNGGRIFYKLDAQGRLTRMKDAPFDAFVGTVYSLVSVDPASGKYLIFRPGGQYYEYDITTDTWRLMPSQHPLTDTYGYFELAEAPITTYGVIMFVMHRPARVYLYKHSATSSSDTVPPAAPTNLKVN